MPSSLSVGFSLCNLICPLVSLCLAHLLLSGALFGGLDRGRLALLLHPVYLRQQRNVTHTAASREVHVSSFAFSHFTRSRPAT